MNVYQTADLASLLQANAYAGRGIVTGVSPSGRYAVSVYFIMGRSDNSRNRVFCQEGDTVRTEPFDPARVEDPSLIIYNAVRPCGSDLIVTNGDQTDTVYDALAQGSSFAAALATRSFEPDAPNLTPRISSVLHLAGGKASYEMSILKSIDPAGSDCCRYLFCYPACPGLGHFLHTYLGDGSPLPTFCGEPERVSLPEDIDTLTDAVWQSLDADNKISLYVRYTDIADGSYRDRLINKHSR